MDGINNFHPSVRFTAKWSTMSFSFLNTQVSINKEGVWSLTWCVKPADTNQYSTSRVAIPTTPNVAFHIAKLSGSAAGGGIICKGCRN